MDISEWSGQSIPRYPTPGPHLTWTWSFPMIPFEGLVQPGSGLGLESKMTQVANCFRCRKWHTLYVIQCIMGAALATFILPFSLQPKKFAGHSVCEVDCNLLQATFSFVSFKVEFPFPALPNLLVSILKASNGERMVVWRAEFWGSENYRFPIPRFCFDDPRTSTVTRLKGAPV